MRRIQAFILGIALLLSSLYIPQEVWGEEEQSETAQSEEETQTAAENQAAVEISAPSAVLMEASTGTVIYEKDADTARPPASVTKVMTMLLIFDALEAGSIKLEDEVTTSEYAASMGGSQVFLEPGETQTVDTMLKCIAVASANDACVAMAEYICGSEEEFVRRMNERADGLGMANTTFVNCNGLDAEGHVTSARDIAIMSRELITRYPRIFDYTGIWMEDITHNTARGSSTFTLSSTNKLLKQYQWATGLKTGSTSKAKYCVCATAERNGIELIAVIMAAPDYKGRFDDAVTLLNYGYSVCALYRDENRENLPDIRIAGGVKDEAGIACREPFVWLDTKGSDLGMVEKTLRLPEEAQAPVEAGQKAGEAVYRLDGRTLGTVDVVYTESVAAAGLGDYLKKVLAYFLL